MTYVVSPELTEGIRPYGPGKFDSKLDEYVYQASLDGGPDEELGSCQEIGIWYGLMKPGHTIFRDNDPLYEELTDTESSVLIDCAGVIISENSSGFVGVEYYETDEELQADWSDLLRCYEEDNSE
jgi:hypothetical protein